MEGGHVFNMLNNKNTLRICLSIEDIKLNGSLILAVTPKTLVENNNLETNILLKPIDFLTKNDIAFVKQWSVDTVIELSQQWKCKGGFVSELINTIGLDLAVLLETLKVAEIVLKKIVNKYGITKIVIPNIESASNNMLQFESHGLQYVELITKTNLLKNLNVNLEIEKNKSEVIVANKNVFSPPKWKTAIRIIISYLRFMSKLKISIFSIFLYKIGFRKIPNPNLIVAANKDNRDLLKTEKSIMLNDFLNVLNIDNIELLEFKNTLIKKVELFFTKNNSLNKDFQYEFIIKKRLLNFIMRRNDLLSSYIKVKNLFKINEIKLIVPSAIGTGIDAWASLGIKEGGGIIISTQHGSAYGNAYHPMMLFSDGRFDYFFSYSNPITSPSYEFILKNGNAKWLEAGSSYLYKIKANSSSESIEVNKILYVMNLCVPFYSVNFPWEFIVDQIKVLELLNSFGRNYKIDIKKESSGAIDETKYPNLNFINHSPSAIQDNYDLLIAESAISTYILEAVVSKKFIAVMTAMDWEDCSRESFLKLNKRAECFENYDNFILGLHNILTNPKKYLTKEKIHSKDYENTYCNPVHSSIYIDNIIKSIYI